MTTRRFELFDRYPICCKAFLPDCGAVEKILIGVHGFAGDKESSMLKKLGRAATAKGWGLVCFDFPAHGVSLQEADDLTVDNCIADLLAVAAWARETFPHAQPCVFATSFGGYISLLAADRLEGCPMVLRAPAVTMDEVLQNAILHVSADEFRRAKVMECGFERKIALPYAFYEDLTEHDPFAQTYTQPMLIIHGAKDDVVPPADVARFCQGRIGVRLTVMENADHRFKNAGELDAIVDAAIRFFEN